MQDIEIKLLRKRYGETQKVFAARLGISERTLRKYEKDQIEPSELVESKLLKLKEELRVKVDLDAVYYHIFHKENNYGGITEWVDFVDVLNDNFTEIRVLREFSGSYIAENIEDDEIVINTYEDIKVYYTEHICGYVKKDICERYMKGYLSPYFVTVEEQKQKMNKSLDSLYRNISQNP